MNVCGEEISTYEDRMYPKDKKGVFTKSIITNPDSVVVLYAAFVKRMAEHYPTFEPISVMQGPYQGCIEVCITYRI